MKQNKLSTKISYKFEETDRVQTETDNRGRIFLYLIPSNRRQCLAAGDFFYCGSLFMDGQHSRMVGDGSTPGEPVVGYLARSTSAFYALMGGLLWVLSFDLPRYRSVLIYLGVAFTLFGVLLGVFNWVEGMPRFWSICEGPFDIVFGLVIFFYSLRIGKSSDLSDG